MSDFFYPHRPATNARRRFQFSLRGALGWIAMFSVYLAWRLPDPIAKPMFLISLSMWLVLAATLGRSVGRLASARFGWLSATISVAVTVLRIDFGFTRPSPNAPTANIDAHMLLFSMLVGIVVASAVEVGWHAFTKSWHTKTENDKKDRLIS